MAGFLASRVRKLQESIGTATVTEDTEEVKEVKEVSPHALARPSSALTLPPLPQHLKQLKTINTNIVKYSKQYTAQHESTSQEHIQCEKHESNRYGTRVLQNWLVPVRSSRKR